MIFKLFLADCTGNKSNVLYPNKVVVSSEDLLKEAVSKDHVCGEFVDGRRSNSNFIASDVIVMDCDNDHSENPDDWITPKLLEEMLADIDFVVVPSRHDMLPKGNKTARPRFHIYFPIKEVKDADTYAGMKEAIHKKYPFFDDNALDAARFIFGTDVEEVTWNEGWAQIDDFITVEATEHQEEPEGEFDGTIAEGSRNRTMSRYAGRLVTRFGASEKAHELFLERAKKCNPPLDDDELSTIWNSACKFAKKVQSQEGYVPPEEYENDFAGGAALKPEDYSDIGEAKVLVREYGNELLFSNATDYMRFDGDLWVENKQLAVGAMEEFLDLQLQDARDELEEATQALIDLGVSKDAVDAGGKTLEKSVDKNSIGAYFRFLAAQKYLGFVMKRRDFKYIQSGLNTAKPMLTVDIADLDKDEFLLNTPVATYDLRHGIYGVQPHDPTDLITKITEVAPGDKGAEIWKECLDLIFCNDQELIDYVQLNVGMAVVGKVYAEQMIIAYGGGANGKSTFWNTISRVLGTYSGKLSAETLTTGCKRNVKPEMAELKGKRLIIASEMEEGMRLNTAVVKQLCSTDEIFAEKKYKDPFKFTPSHTLVLYTNHLPKVGANDDGIWRRLKVIPFNAHIVGNSDIKNYADYLFENAGPAIMTWILEGAKKAIERNFKVEEPVCVKEAVERYRQDNDWLGQFLNDCCEVGKDYEEKSGALYQQYRAYCITTGEYTRSTSDFYSSMDKLGFFRHRKTQGVVVQGVKLKEGNDFI